MHVLLLPGMDGTGRLFEPLLRVLPASLTAVVVAYPADRFCGYSELLPFVEAAVPAGAGFIVLGESFSGPLALLLAARNPPGLRGVILCASFARNPFPSLARWLRHLVRPFLFRAIPARLFHWALLGRHCTDSLARMLDAAIAAVPPAVLAVRARAVVSVDVGAQLQACGVPILYLQATEDRVMPCRCLTHITRLQPNVEAVALTGPHLLLQAFPDEAARVIMEFAAVCECHTRVEKHPHAEWS